VNADDGKPRTASFQISENLGPIFWAIVGEYVGEFYLVNSIIPQMILIRLAYISLDGVTKLNCSSKICRKFTLGEFELPPV